MLPWQPFLAFFIWGARWRHLANTAEPSMSGGDDHLILYEVACVKDS